MGADGTVSFQGDIYRVSAELIGNRVTLHYNLLGDITAVGPDGNSYECLPIVPTFSWPMKDRKALHDQALSLIKGKKLLPQFGQRKEHKVAYLPVPSKSVEPTVPFGPAVFASKEEAAIEIGRIIEGAVGRLPKFLQDRVDDFLGEGLEVERVRGFANDLRDAIDEMAASG